MNAYEILGSIGLLAFANAVVRSAAIQLRHTTLRAITLVMIFGILIAAALNCDVLGIGIFQSAADVWATAAICLAAMVWLIFHILGRLAGRWIFKEVKSA